MCSNWHLVQVPIWHISSPIRAVTLGATAGHWKSIEKHRKSIELASLLCRAVPARHLPGRAGISPESIKISIKKHQKSIEKASNYTPCCAEPWAPRPCTQKRCLLAPFPAYTPCRPSTASWAPRPGTSRLASGKHQKSIKKCLPETLFDFDT